MKWAVIERKREIHVVPLQDGDGERGFGHELIVACFCQPALEAAMIELRPPNRCVWRRRLMVTHQLWNATPELRRQLVRVWNLRRDRKKAAR